MPYLSSLVKSYPEDPKEKISGDRLNPESRQALGLESAIIFCMIFWKGSPSALTSYPKVTLRDEGFPKILGRMG
jgi:hypothetical protein